MARPANRWLVETRVKDSDGTVRVYQRTAWPTRQLAEGNRHVMRLFGWERHGYTIHVIDSETVAPKDRKPFIPVPFVCMWLAKEAKERAQKNAQKKAKSRGRTKVF